MKRQQALETKFRSYTVSPGFPFAPRIMATLKYSYSSLCSVAAPDSNVMRLNSLYDPDYTYTGHQPIGFDQYSALYNNYRVISVRVSGEAYNLVAAPAVFVMFANTDLSSITSPFQAAEQPNATKQTVPSGNSLPLRINRNFSMAKICGMTEEEYRTSPNTAATIAANPTNLAVLHNLVCDVVGNPVTNSVAFSLVLTFRAEFFNPVLMAQS